MRAYDNGRGIITGHPVEPLYGRTYLPKKFKIAFTVRPPTDPNPRPRLAWLPRWLLPWPRPRRVAAAVLPP